MELYKGNLVLQTKQVFIECEYILAISLIYELNCKIMFEVIFDCFLVELFF